MKKVKILQKGQNSVGNWFLINEQIGDFFQSKFLAPTDELFGKTEVGTEIEVPVQLLSARS